MCAVAYISELAAFWTRAMPYRAPGSGVVKERPGARCRACDAVYVRCRVHAACAMPCAVHAMSFVYGEDSPSKSLTLRYMSPES